ncbi:hypothetical protein A2U01_0112153, partial [Trifolium medium]|nr:hypothetical protein [Trifolium medium]
GQAQPKAGVRQQGHSGARHQAKSLPATC